MSTETWSLHMSEMFLYSVDKAIKEGKEDPYWKASLVL